MILLSTFIFLVFQFDVTCLFGLRHTVEMMIVYGLGATLASTLVPLVIERISLTVIRKANIELKDYSTIFFLDISIVFHMFSLFNISITIFQSSPKYNIHFTINYKVHFIFIVWNCYWSLVNSRDLWVLSFTWEEWEKRLFFLDY